MISPDSPYYLAIFLGAILFLWFAFNLLSPRTRTIADLPGPPLGSWLVGNIPEITRATNVGDADFAWTRKYGNSVRIRGTFGRDVLFTADPKAFQHILTTACYNFPKAPEFRFFLTLFTGRGLVWAEGTQHSRHRKAMDPAFSFSAVREHLPLFRQFIQQTVAKWRDTVSQSGNMSAQVDITEWLDRTTLDMIGATAFDYRFEALEEEANNELYRAYSNVFVDTFLERSDTRLAFESVCGILPQWVLSILLSSIPNETTTKVRKYMKIARRIARSLVDQKIESHLKGEEGTKDALGLLVRANLSAESKNKLEDEEILAQLTTLMVAGHETTASAVSWALYELSRHRDFQSEIRKEIKDTRARVAQRGDVELNAADLDSMKCLLAALKETLRYHPILPQMLRIAGRDEVIPFSTPQRTSTGELITSIPIRKGQGLMLSVAAYNRLPSVWGEDADIWMPHRFLDAEGKQKPGMGVFSNMATFSIGVRSCIGWRFAMLEMQVMLAELIENFEFSPPSGNIEILRAATMTMNPMVKGSNEARAQLPLTVTPVN